MAYLRTLRRIERPNSSGATPRLQLVQWRVLIDTSTDFGQRVTGRLHEEIVIWLVTVDPNGTPEPSPVWFYWDGDAFLIYSLPGTPRERTSNATLVLLSISTARLAETW
jgi:hypothetical protein